MKEDIYPEISAAGTLVDAVQAELNRCNSALTAGWSTTASGWAKMEEGTRSVVLSMGVDRRYFCAAYWADDLCFGTTETQHLATAVSAAARWLQGEVSTTEMGAEFSDFFASGEGRAFERGKLQEYQWERMLERTDGDAVRYAPFLRAARQKTFASTMTPYVGMGVLRFSRKPTYPYSEGGPLVVARPNGLFRVGDALGNVLGEDGPEDAAEILERVLREHQKS